jgi:hypothetical protein
MKKLIVITVLAILVSAIAIVSIKATTKIDLHEMTSTHHVFGYYPTIKHRIERIPTKVLVIPIDSTTGNYIYNPSKVTFAKYLALCVVDTNMFSVKGYYEYTNK